jgi:hypothetical protein
MSYGAYFELDNDVRCWEDSGGVMIKAVTAQGDPVELSVEQARSLNLDFACAKGEASSGARSAHEKMPGI